MDSSGGCSRVTFNFFFYYNIAVSLITLVGLGYVMYLHRKGAKYERFVFFTIAGIGVFVGGGSIAELLWEGSVHFVHALAAALIILGMYDPIRNDLRKDQWARLVLRDPRTVRRSSEWMAPMDDQILELFHSSKLVLTPAIIAYNIDHSREEVNRRLTKLEENGLVHRVERGKYRLTPLGEGYLQGEPMIDSDSSAHNT